MEPALMVGGVALRVHTGGVTTVAPAACVTVNVLPAMVNVPVRADVPVLAATVYVTLPLPLPEAPEVMVSQLASLVAVQAHVDVTLTLPELAIAATEALLAPNPYVQAFTVTVALAAVPVPPALVPVTL